MSGTFFMVGPTAVGKSSLALAVAEHCSAEIVGADAFQIYAGFDRLTAKPSLEDQARVPHHLIGTVSPTETYNVARYLEDARHCLTSIHRRRKRAIVVGGTGLYVKALTHGLSSLPEADPALRAELDQLELPMLLSRLHALDPVAAATIDANNKRRVVRAIEVCLLTRQPFSSSQTLWKQPPPDGKTSGVFFMRPKIDLQNRIENRVEAMFDHGVVEEVRAAQVTSLGTTAERMIGWRDIQDLLAGQQTLARCREKIVVATRQYAKRQVTWFQREKYFARLDLSTFADEESTVAWLCERVMQTPLDASALRN